MSNQKKLEELRATRTAAESVLKAVDAEIAALESAPQFPDGWDRMPIPGEIVETRFPSVVSGYVLERFVRFLPQAHEFQMETCNRIARARETRPIDWSTVPRETWPKAHPSMCAVQTEDGFRVWSEEGIGIPFGTPEEKAAANALLRTLIRGVK